MGSERKVPFLIQWLTWPSLFGGSVAALYFALRGLADPASISGAAIVVSAISLIVLESLFALRREWRMTWQSFRRDLKYFAITGATIAATTALLARLGIEMGARATWIASGLPLIVQIPLALVAFEFVQYWQHRASHELSGRFGGFLWRTHAPHHLPDAAYVLMHPAGHPINDFVVRGIATILPLWLLGVSPEAILYVNLIIGIQGLVSHTNLDLRAGWFNYLFVGTELHRSHHSADPGEGLNYGVVTPLWDIVFGTFRYRPGHQPERLGVRAPQLYPSTYDVHSALLLPFKRGATVNAATAQSRKKELL